MARDDRRVVPLSPRSEALTATLWWLHYELNTHASKSGRYFGYENGNLPPILFTQGRSAMTVPTRAFAFPNHYIPLFRERTAVGTLASWAH